jgi:hypothetical protein
VGGRGLAAAMTGSRRSLRWSSAASPLHCSSLELFIGVGAALPSVWVVQSGMGLLVFLHGHYGEGCVDVRLQRSRCRLLGV